MTFRTRHFLPLILFIAFAVRLWGLGFGLPHIVARPDETEVAGPAVGFLSGDLRPPFFEWPTLFTYTAALLYVIYFLLAKPFGGHATLEAFAESRRQSIAPFLYITRSLSVMMGVLTVWWVYKICRRLFDETIAIVAALFLALAFLHVRDSHFGVTDVAMTGLVVLAVLAILRWRETGNALHTAIAGLIAGLAGSTKYNGLGAGLPFAVALAQRAVDDVRARSAVVAGRHLALGSLVFGAAAAIGFFGASPFILIDWPRFVDSVSGVASHVAEGHGVSMGRGWLYYASVVLPAAIGWPMFAAGIAGMLTLFVRRSRDAAVLFAFPIAYYLVAGRGYTEFARYIIPVLPFLCIAAAWLIVTGVRVLARDARPATRGALITAASFAIVAPTAAKTLAFDRLLATTDNRIVVARAVIDIVSSDHSFYQSGERYGHIPVRIDGREIAHFASYDTATGRFEEEPHWILLQRSPLVIYSAVPASLEQIVRERYVLVRRFPTGNDHPSVVYDQQDAFFLPLKGLGAIARPGPAFELYRRKRALMSVKYP
jgi:hypothetical protein